MRALTVNEWSLVAGGDGGEEPMDEVVVTGKRCKEKWSCLSPEELEAFLENTYTAPPSGGGGGGALPDGISVAKTEELLAKAMAEQNEELRNQALVGLALATLGTVVLAYPPSVVALGIAGLVAKFGIAASAGVLITGGTWMFGAALTEFYDGE